MFMGKRITQKEDIQHLKNIISQIEQGKQGNQFENYEDYCEYQDGKSIGQQGKSKLLAHISKRIVQQLWIVMQQEHAVSQDNVKLHRVIEELQIELQNLKQENRELKGKAQQNQNTLQRLYYQKHELQQYNIKVYHECATFAETNHLLEEESAKLKKQIDTMMDSSIKKTYSHLQEDELIIKLKKENQELNKMCQSYKETNAVLQSSLELMEISLQENKQKLEKSNVKREQQNYLSPEFNDYSLQLRQRNSLKKEISGDISGLQEFHNPHLHTISDFSMTQCDLHLQNESHIKKGEILILDERVQQKRQPKTLQKVKREHKIYTRQFIQMKGTPKLTHSKSKEKFNSSSKQIRNDKSRFRNKVLQKKMGMVPETLKKSSKKID